MRWLFISSTVIWVISSATGSVASRAKTELSNDWARWNNPEYLDFLRETCVKLEDLRTQIMLPWDKPNFLYKLTWTMDMNKYSFLNRNSFDLWKKILYVYNAILYRASTGPEQGFPCWEKLTGKTLFSLQGWVCSAHLTGRTWLVP